MWVWLYGTTIINHQDQKKQQSVSNNNYKNKYFLNWVKVEIYIYKNQNNMSS